MRALVSGSQPGHFGEALRELRDQPQCLDDSAAHGIVCGEFAALDRIEQSARLRGRSSRSFWVSFRAVVTD